MRGPRWIKSNRMKHIITTIFLFYALAGKSYSQPSSPADTFPVPKGNPYQLFYLQRQPNTNTIVVELNVKSGRVDPENPVHVFWIRYTEDGRREGLSFIQRTFAYGVQVNKIAENAYDLNFVSYKKMKFRLEKGDNNLWRVYANLKNGSRIILRRVYIHINGGSFWKPNVEYVELKGDEPGTYLEQRERLTL